jgi:hypothetical protein
LEPTQLTGGPEGKRAQRAEPEGTYDAAFEGANTPNCMATSCPPIDKKYEPGNILKTKGSKRAFSKNEPENILKIKPLTKNRRNPQKA